MKRNAYDLPRLLAELNPHAELAQRHLWLIHLIEWVRAAHPSTEGAVERVRLFLDALDADPDAAARLQLWWLQFIDQVDITTLLADFGFAPRTAFLSELTERLRYKLLPSTPLRANSATAGWPAAGCFPACLHHNLCRKLSIANRENQALLTTIRCGLASAIVMTISP